jgi:membrane protease YdiL (CAAX protease family)
MSLIYGYLAVLLLPLLYVGIPNPVEIQWYWRHGTVLMPSDMERRAVRVGAVMTYAALIALLGFTSLLIKRSRTGLRSYGVTAEAWHIAIGGGCLAGSLWLCIYILLLFFTRPTHDQLVRHALRQESSGFWIVSGLLAAFVEEFWRAFCLVTIAPQGISAAVLVTSAACGVAHGPRRGRMASAALFAVFEAWLFFTTDSIWTTISAHVTVNVGTIVLIHAYSGRANRLSSEALRSLRR